MVLKFHAGALTRSHTLLAYEIFVVLIFVVDDLSAKTANICTPESFQLHVYVLCNICITWITTSYMIVYAKHMQNCM